MCRGNLVVHGSSISEYLIRHFIFLLRLSPWTARRASTPFAPTSVSQVMGRRESSLSGEGVGVVQSPLSSSSSVSRLSTVMVMPESASLSDSEEVEEIEFNSHIGGEGCLPNSSYYEEDTLLTWADITGVAIEWRYCTYSSVRVGTVGNRSYDIV